MVNVTNIRRQSAAVLRAHRQPGVPRRLKSHTRAQCIPLILRHRELARIRQRIGCIASQEQSACDRSLSNAGLVCIAEVSVEAPPLRNFQADFFTDDPRLRERDRKAYTGIRQYVVVRILPKIAAEYVGIKAQLSEECIVHSAFIKISASRPHRQSQHRRADRIKEWRTRKEQILDSRRLKNAIVRSMKKQVEPRHESRYSDSCTPS